MIIMKIDVVVHPYFSECEGYVVDSFITAEKTRRWRRAINGLGPADYLVFVRSDHLCHGDRNRPSPAYAVQLEGNLLNYAQTILGERVLVYDLWPGEDVKDRLGSPAPSDIECVRVYGEFRGFCVNRVTGMVRTMLGLYKEYLKKVSEPPELSVPSCHPFNFDDIDPPRLEEVAFVTEELVV